MNRKTEKITALYTKMPLQAKASFWYTISNVMLKGIALFVTPIFTRIMTPEQYGYYSVYQSWYEIILIVGSLSLAGDVAYNMLTKNNDDKYKIMAALQGLSTVATAALFVLYLVNISFWNSVLGLSTIVVLAMFLHILFEPSYRYWLIEQRYDYKYKGIVIITISMALVTPILGIISVMHTPHKAEARILSFVFVHVAIGMFFYIYNWKKGRIFFHAKYWAFALRFNIPLLPHYLSAIILHQADRIIIAQIVGRREAAIYSIAYTLSLMMNIITGAIRNSFLPYTYQSLQKGDYQKLKSNTRFIIIFVGGLYVLTMFLSPEIIRVFATKEYANAIWIVPPIAASGFLIFVYNIFVNVELYYERTKATMSVTVAAAIANVGLNYIFIGRYGYLAAGYTTLFCYIFVVIAHFFVYRRIIRKEIPEVDDVYEVKSIAGVSIAMLVIMGGMLFVYRNDWLRYGILAILILALFLKRKMLIAKMQEIRRA